MGANYMLSVSASPRMSAKQRTLVGAVDQGTSSSRFLVGLMMANYWI